MTLDNQTNIYSSYLLTSDEINQIIAKFPFIKGSSVNNILDEKILAGIRIHHGSKIIDLTSNNKLSNLKKKLYETS